MSVASVFRGYNPQQRHEVAQGFSFLPSRSTYQAADIYVALKSLTCGNAVTYNIIAYRCYCQVVRG